MHNIRIITDSASDIPVELEKELNIKILSFPITVGEAGYLERIDFTNKEFYKILETEEEIPSTAQITQIQFEDVYKELYDEGVTDIIHVSINSTGSNTYSSSLMATESFYNDYPNARTKMNIYNIDSHTYTAGYGFPVIEAAKKIQKGISVQEIVDYLEDWFASVEVFFAPYTLKYVKKSGRVSAAAAFMGELIGLRPIISMIDGESNISEKVRGDKKIVPSLVEQVVQRIIPETPYSIIRGALDGYPDELAKELTKQLGYPPERIYYAGAAITINSGPDLIGVCFKGIKRR
ncbi:MAG: DegV family protein [Clostridiales bacterium]|nr:DegV family protein [Clostridiales bacterium]